MKIRNWLIGILLLFSINMMGQIDTSMYYNLKLKSNKVQISEKRDGGGYKFKNMGLPDTYFFFTQNGIYGADSYGILIYEFLSELTFEEEYHYNRYEIKAKDTELNLKCSIVVYDYHDDNRYKLFIVYKNKEFIFNCVDMN